MENVKITIDGHVLEVPPDTTILNAALSSEIYIPHLCHHPDLPDIGACRLCVVEIEGTDEIKTSCTEKVAEGMVIHTKTDKLGAMRRLSMELMLANHVDDCTTCPKYLKCELQSLIQYLGVSTSRMRRTLNAVNINTDNPLIVRDLNRCISCGRCVRVCKDVRGVHALEFEMTEEDRIMVDIRDHKTLSEESCRFCGACVEVCPTGALQDKEGVFDESNLNRELRLVPCKAECPANIDVPKYIRFIKEGNYQQAIAVIREKAPFPLTLGYVCMAFCEKECRRKELNGALAIRELKKFAAEQDDGLWRKRRTIKPATDKKIAVIGSGPAGLTAAYYLAKSGHSVTVYEKSPVAGGMLATGIPKYRLPAEILAAEIKEIEAIGVKILLNEKVEDIASLKAKGYDRIILAIGTGKGVRLPLDGAESDNVLLNLDFLEAAALNRPVAIGERVVVLGGGNIAFDCARTAKRLGSKEVTVICLEEEGKMTASADEIEEGTEEGIQILNSRTFVSLETEGSAATGVKCSKVASFFFDESKRLQLNIEPDSEHVVPADTIIFATGQRPDIPEGWKLPLGRGNLIATQDGTKVDESIYAVGDAVYGTHSVIRAIASGRNAAAEIDKSLGGDGNIDDQLSDAVHLNPYIGTDEDFLARQRAVVAVKELAARIDNFDEIAGRMPDCTAGEESNRCLQCDLRTCLTRPKIWANYKIN